MFPDTLDACIVSVERVKSAILRLYLIVISINDQNMATEIDKNKL